MTTDLGVFSKLRVGVVFGMPFRCPQLSQIDDSLWMGGTPSYVGEPLPALFKYVVNIDPGHAYEVAPGTQMIIRRMHDAPFLPELAMLEETAQSINWFRGHGPTLVHCEGGWNRSGLVTALALIRSGMTPDAAIALLREKRSPTVLYNQTFEQWLRSLG